MAADRRTAPEVVCLLTKATETSKQGIVREDTRQRVVSKYEC